MAGLSIYPIIKAFRKVFVENGQSVILDNVDYLWKTINTAVLSDSISGGYHV